MVYHYPVEGIFPIKEVTVLNRDNWGGANAGSSSAYAWMVALATGVVVFIGNAVYFNPPVRIVLVVVCVLGLVVVTLVLQLTKMSLLEKRARRAM